MSNEQQKDQVVYSVNESPKSKLAFIVLSLQHPLSMFGGMLIAPLLLAAALGMNASQTALLVSLGMVGAGVTTLLQSLFGIKLPVVQTMSVAFVASYIIIGQLVEGSPELAMRYIIGAVILGGIFEAILGFTGLVGYLKRVITPVVIGPVLVLIGLVTSETAIEWSAENIVVSIATASMILFLSYILPKLKVGKKIRYVRAVSVIISVVVMYIITLILSKTGSISETSSAYIDLSFVSEAPWFILPLPIINWGMPIFKIEYFLIIIAAYLVSIVESVGDYYAVSSAAKTTMPTSKQISKGIGFEGLGSAISGSVGGLASTSAAENIGLVETTGVASRFVVAGGEFF